MPMHFERKRLTERAETALGLTLAVTPVTLWVAWTPWVFLVVVTVAVISAGLLVLLHGQRGSASGDGHAMRQSEWARPALPGGFVEEIHRLFPLTYHHSRIESPRFRRAMQELQRMLR